MPDLKAYFDELVNHYNQQSFIESDPISVPHRFALKQDIEISGFFASIFAWGQRKTIINKANALLSLMDDAPYDFIINHKPYDLRRFEQFKHRTFQPTDLLYLLKFLQLHYQSNDSLEDAFFTGKDIGCDNLENRMNTFHDYVFSLPEVPHRTKKHLSAPYRKSRVKRINMFLRWMVRKDQKVDFGIWEKIKPSELFIPLDLHVEKVARKYGLLNRKQADWLSVIELTEKLREWDPLDPVKYDYALFGSSVSRNTP